MVVEGIETDDAFIGVGGVIGSTDMCAISGLIVMIGDDCREFGLW